jgi:hypothetical protein
MQRNRQPGYRGHAHRTQYRNFEGLHHASPREKPNDPQALIYYIAKIICLMT